MARATASILGERDEKARAGAGVEEERGRHCSCLPPPPGSTSSPGPPHLPWPPKVPFLVLPPAHVAPFAPLDLFSPDRFLRSMLRADPKQPCLTKVQTFALPASAPSQISPFPLSRTESLIPLLSLLPPPGKKKKAPTPQGGAADSKGGTGRRARTTKGGGSQIPGRAGQGVTERRGVKAVAAPVLCHPCPLSRGLEHNQGDRCVWGQV